MRFDGKVAIVTGGARGIGEGISRGFAREGAQVVIADILDDVGNKTASDIVAKGGKAICLKADVTSSKNVNAVVKEVLSRFGEIDILVNDVGWDRPEPFIVSAEETWDKVIAINYKSTVICCRAVLDHMIERKYGKIVNIGSDAGRVGSTGEVVYSGCKGAVIAFTKALAREMVRYNINVNCVCPGPTETPIVMNEMAKASPKLLDALKHAIPMGRLGKPEEIAAGVLFMASDDARFVTGQTLSVSGGLTMS